MRHSLDIYARPVVVRYGGAIAFAGNFRIASIINNVVLGVFIPAIITFGMLAVPVDGEVALSWQWAACTTALLALIELVHLALWRTHDRRGLGPKQCYILNIFTRLPDSLQKDLGGRQEFIRLLRNTSPAHLASLKDKVERAAASAKAARTAELEAQSDIGDASDTLEAFIEVNKFYTKMLGD